MALLSAEDVVMRFRGVTALDHVSITAEQGVVTGLIGPNGAGKTTIFNIITGLQKPTSGRVRIDGVDVTSLAVHKRARKGLARTFQRLEVFSSLTVREHIQVAGEIHRFTSRERFDIKAQTNEILERCGLTALADQPAESLSTGFARMTELGRALASRPRMLLLDEPGSGLDSAESKAFGRLLGDLAAGGLGVLLVEHDMDLIMEVCTHIHVLDFGVHLMSGTPDEVRNDVRVQKAYLGDAPDDALHSPDETPAPAAERQPDPFLDDPLEERNVVVLPPRGAPAARPPVKRTPAKKAPTKTATKTATKAPTKAAAPRPAKKAAR
ncbi:MAG TPA: ABC transporter ATP-binding protein [Mycobacteriales bacterium]|nr:ABC transporter ATP-binding protein [Mycobacteriales bacterium]